MFVMYFCSNSEAPRYRLYAFTIISQSLAIALYLYFLITGYVTSTTQSYLSMDSSSNCETVTKPFSGTFHASDVGYWSGSADYNSGGHIYTLILNDIELHSDAEFKDFMDANVKVKLQELAVVSETLTLAENLLILMNSALPFTHNDQINFFFFAGNPQAVFDVDYRFASFGSAHRTCNSSLPTVNWLQFITTARITWNTNDYDCTDILDPRTFGFTPALDVSNFVVKMDHNSLTTAAAVNFNLIPLDYLSNVYHIKTFTFHSVTYALVLKVSSICCP